MNNKIFISLIVLCLSKNATVIASEDDRTDYLKNYSPAMQTLMFFNIARTGSVDSVKQILANGMDVNITDESGRTACMMATYDKRQDIVNCLLKHGANPGIVDRYGWTAFTLGTGRGAQVLSESIKEDETRSAVVQEVLSTHRIPTVVTGLVQLYLSLYSNQAVRRGAKRKGEAVEHQN